MEQIEEMLEVLSKFSKCKVRVVYDSCCSTVAYTYMNFIWNIDIDNLVFGDKDTTHEDFSSINLDEILDVAEINDEIIEIELSEGRINIELDKDYSLCYKCGSKHPIFYMRDINEQSDKEDIKLCQNCFNEFIETCIVSHKNGGDLHV